MLDPPMPTPELIHEEFFSYKKTIFQEHLFGLFFRESCYEIEDNSSLDPALVTALAKVDSHKPLLISEVIQIITLIVQGLQKSVL